MEMYGLLIQKQPHIKWSPMSLVILPSRVEGNGAGHYPALQSTPVLMLCPTPHPHPTPQACRARYLSASPGAVASLRSAMESSWSFQGGTHCMWGQLVFRHSFTLSSSLPGPRLEDVVTHGQIPPTTFSCPLGQSLHNKVKLDWEAGL